MENTVLEALVNHVKVGSLDENSQATFKMITRRTFFTTMVILSVAVTLTKLLMTIRLIYLITTVVICKTVMTNKISKQKLRLRAQNTNHNHNNINREFENNDEINNCNKKYRNSNCNSFNDSVFDYPKLMETTIIIIIILIINSKDNLTFLMQCSEKAAWFIADEKSSVKVLSEQDHFISTLYYL